MVVKKSQGGSAVKSGKECRQDAADMLEHLARLDVASLPRVKVGQISGVAAFDQSREALRTRGKRTDGSRGVMWRNVQVGTSLAYRKLMADFVVWPDAWDSPMALSIQYQRTSGSADCKAINRVLSLLGLDGMPGIGGTPCEIPFGVMLDGPEFLGTGSRIADFARRVHRYAPERCLMVLMGQAGLREWVQAGMKRPQG